MDLNSFLFPAPKSSYSAERLHGELIWIPKNPRPCEEDIIDSAIRQHTAPELGSDASDGITYHAQLLKLKNLVSVADSKCKPKGVEPEADEISFITTGTTKRLGVGGDLDGIDGLDIPANENKLVELALADNQDLSGHSANFPQENTSSKQGQTDRGEPIGSVIVVEEPKTNLLPDYYIRSPKTSILEKDNQKFSFVNHVAPQKCPAKPNTVEKQPLHTSHRREISLTSFDLTRISECVDQRAIPVTTPKTMKNQSTKLLFRAETTLKNKTELSSFRINEKDKENYDNECDLEATNREIDGLTSSSPMKGTPLAKEPTEFRAHTNRLNTEIPKDTERIKLEDIRAPGYNKFLKQKTLVEKMTSDTYIPCMLLRAITSSSKLMIYFHGNGEDINLAYELLTHARNNLNVNVLAIEYPGYGLYKGTPNEATILEDSEQVYDYLVTFLKINPKDIILFGRSIGSGPATHLASKRDVGALILMSGFTSIKSVVRDIAGSWAQYLIKERFNNLEAISKVEAPVFLIHGQRDRLISYQHSEKLHDACRAPCELILPKNMDHIEFDFDEDFVLPLIQFLGRCGINVGTWRNSGKIFFPKKLFEVPDIFKPKKKQEPPKELAFLYEKKKKMIQKFATISDATNKQLNVGEAW